MIQRSLVLIKSDGVQRGLMGEIITRFEKAGFKIIGVKMVWINKDFAKKHYLTHIGKPFYKGLEEMITMGPLLAMVIEGVEAVENIRKIVGSTEPKGAAPGTIRGDFAHVSYGHSDKHGKALRNLIHASGTIEEAKTEIEMWFTKEELHVYKNVHEIHTF